MTIEMISRTGIEDAIYSLYLSRRKLTPELQREIHLSYIAWQWDKDADPKPERAVDLEKRFQILLNYGKKHITLLKFINYGFLVRGMHRGGQDDWDSHAKRFNNRIIRSSTRMAMYDENEYSDYYRDKIITDKDALNILHPEIELPESFSIGDGEEKAEYIKAVNGYVKKEYEDDQDVHRGLYMLSIPSDFIFQVDLAELAHIYKQRGADSHAHPEVKELCEKMVDLVIQDSNGLITRDYLKAVEN